MNLRDVFKFVVLVLLVLLLAGAADATPFLKCTPAPEQDVVGYEVQVNGTVQSALGTLVDGAIQLLDLDGLSPGAYIFNARAVDASGLKGDWIPVPFSGTKPAVLTGLGITD